MQIKYLHVGSLDKFTSPFIDFINKTLDVNLHLFVFYNGYNYKTEKSHPNVRIFIKGKLQKLFYLICLAKKMHQSEKIVLHGLFDMHIVIMLFLMPWLLQKSDWVMWGGDLYIHKLGLRNHRWRINEFLRRAVIKKMGGIITYLKGDYELAQQWYKATGQYKECFMYPSNLYKDYQVRNKDHSGVNILVGNSADPSNNHLEVFDKLSHYKELDITIFAPLTYGDQKHARRVINEGKKIFGGKFQPLTKHLPFEEYLELLSIVDIAVFNHNRQQAMGNTISLLGLGKKVYMRSDVTQWELFQSLGVDVSDIYNGITLSELDSNIRGTNIEKIKRFFSKENYINQLKELFK